MPFRDEEEEDTLYDDVVRMADRMQLKGEKRRTYIHDHMLQGGYEPVQTRESYQRKVREEEEGTQSDSSRWFGRSREERTRSRRDDDDTF